MPDSDFEPYAIYCVLASGCKRLIGHTADAFVDSGGYVWRRVYNPKIDGNECRTPDALKSVVGTEWYCPRLNDHAAPRVRINPRGWYCADYKVWRNRNGFSTERSAVKNFRSLAQATSWLTALYLLNA